MIRNILRLFSISMVLSTRRPILLENSRTNLNSNTFSSGTSSKQVCCPGSDDEIVAPYGLEVWCFYQADVKDHLHTISDRFAKLVVDEPDEDAAKRQEPDQIPEVFRPDSGTGIKSQPEFCINESDKDADSNTCDGQDKSVL